MIYLIFDFQVFESVIFFFQPYLVDAPRYTLTHSSDAKTEASCAPIHIVFRQVEVTRLATVTVLSFNILLKVA